MDPTAPFPGPHRFLIVLAFDHSSRQKPNFTKISCPQKGRSADVETVNYVKLVVSVVSVRCWGSRCCPQEFDTPCGAPVRSLRLFGTTWHQQKAQATCNPSQIPKPHKNPRQVSIPRSLKPFLDFPGRPTMCSSEILNKLFRTFLVYVEYHQF